MENIKNHPAPDRLDSFDKYPPYYGQDLELAYTPLRSVFTLWAPTASKTRLNIYSSGEEAIRRSSWKWSPRTTEPGALPSNAT